MYKIYEEAQKIHDEIVAHRRYLHQIPEVGLDLPQTSEYVCNELVKLGIEPKRIVPHGVVALIGKGKVDKTVLLRADMDALPINELVESDFKSTNGNMHACGHDFHAAMLLGAAKLLKAHEDEIDGYVKLMFQPGEEGFGGALTMIEAGVLENPKVDCAMMMHVFSGYPLDAGEVAAPAGGPFMASGDYFKVTITGKGCHGAMSYMGVDPITVGVHIHLAFQELIARENEALRPATLTIGSFQGGRLNNVIPDTAVLAGSLRAFSTENRNFLAKRMEEVAKGVAAAYRATAEIEFEVHYPPLVIDNKMATDFKAFMTKNFGENSFKTPDVLLTDGKFMASEDFAYVAEKVPSVMIMFGAGSAKDGFSFPHHHPKVDFDDSAVAKGAAIYAGFALDMLNK